MLAVLLVLSGNLNSFIPFKLLIMYSCLQSVILLISKATLLFCFNCMLPSADSLEWSASLLF
jgi:hypothetical protein